MNNRVLSLKANQMWIWRTLTFCGDQTSAPTSECLSETGSCSDDYNEDHLNCWWQIMEPVEDLRAAALPGEQLEKQSSILLLLKSLLSLIKQKKKHTHTLKLYQNWFVIWSQILKMLLFWEYKGFVSLCKGWVRVVRTGNKTPCSVTLWLLSALTAFNG